MKGILVYFLLLGLADYAFGDYENTWNFYYEQPCCGNTNGQHHLRHHKGIIKKIFSKKYFSSHIYLQTMLESLLAENFIIDRFIWMKNRMHYMLVRCESIR